MVCHYGCLPKASPREGSGDLGRSAPGDQAGKPCNADSPDDVNQPPKQADSLVRSWLKPALYPAL